MNSNEKVVDSYRFLGGMSKRMMRNWAKIELPREIPWTPLGQPLSESTVALISSAGLALRSDTPFDQQIERDNPWYSDPSYRVIPVTATAGDVRSYHLHINPDFVHEDLNCALPLERLRELEASGEIGRAAPSHYSYIGYTCQPERLLNESVPAIIEQLRAEAVDAVVLIPI